MAELSRKQSLAAKARAAALAAIPASERVSARQFCDIQWLIESGLSDAEIAAKVELAPEKVTRIIAEGEMRTVIESEARKSRDAKERDRWVRAVGLASRSLSLAGFAMAGKAAAEGDAFAFSLAARGTKAFVDMARQADGLDGKDGPTSGIPSVALFFFSGDVLRTGEGQHGSKQAESIVVESKAVSEDELGFA